MKDQPNWVTEYNYGPSKLPEILRAIRNMELVKKYSKIICKGPNKNFKNDAFSR